MQEFNFIKHQFISLGLPINEHYLNRYLKFILSLPILNREDGYCESHHILPSSLFSQYTNKSFSWNQKSIDAKAHMICHWMLWKALPKNDSMCYAFYGMSHQIEGRRSYKINSKTYAKMRMDWSIINSEQLSKRFKGKQLSEEHKAKIREARKNQIFSEETRAKIGASRRGMKQSEEAKAKQILAQTGRKHSEETKAKLRGQKRSEEVRAKMSASAKGKPKSEEHKAKLRVSNCNNLFEEF